jgi:L-lactate dehydrogenase complex protein LldE
MTGGPRVGLFVTCLVDLFRPSVGFATIKLLEDAGCKVEVPLPQTCCGQPWFNSGMTKEAQEVARSVITSFEPFDYVVVPSGSCAGMIRRYFPTLFESDAAFSQRAKLIAAKTYELTDFLVRVLRVERVVDAAYPARCAYHDSCSALRDLGVRQQPRKLLASVYNLTVTELSDPEACCGFGGLFATKYASISKKIGEEKVNDIVSKGVDTLVGPDLGCLLHLSGKMTAIGTPIRVRHIAEVLAGDLKTPGIGEESSQ